MSFSKDFDHDGERLRVQLRSAGESGFQVSVGGRNHAVTAVRLPDGRVRFTLGEETFEAAAGRTSNGDIHVCLDDQSYLLVGHAGRRSAAPNSADDGVIVAPMTGTVLEIKVEEGETVTADTTVAVVSAMKMEHKLLAGVDGEVVEIATDAGATVDQGALILRIEPS